jgi:DNA-binding response OmpR family regulator
MAEKQKILIVDDDENIAELISLYLTKECYETKIVGDGEEALAVFPVFKPNLVLLDLMLPGIDGYQVCRELRTSSQVPIIMLSAKGEIFDKVLGLELGADDYMIKPFDSKELVARAKELGMDSLAITDHGVMYAGTGWFRPEGTVCGISGFNCEPDQLLCHLQRPFH